MAMANEVSVVAIIAAETRGVYSCNFTETFALKVRIWITSRAVNAKAKLKKIKRPRIDAVILFRVLRKM